MIFSRISTKISRIFSRIFERRHKPLLSGKGMFVIIFLCGVLFLVPQFVFAGDIVDIAKDSITSWTLSLFTGIISIIIKLVGGLLVLLIDILVRIASYNDFLDAQGIRLGWAVVRDIGNMFLVMIFLVIAFGTVFRIQGLEYKSTLTKFFMMAILANFSFTFAGLMIDIAQVIMQTFVNAFQETAASLIVSSFGLKSFLDLADLTKDDSFLEALATPIAAILFLIIGTMTILALVVILIARIVMLWILTVLSPMPWILNILPNTSKYASQWWQEWTKNLITGPVLAFFLWLAFMMIRFVDTEAILKKSTIGLGAGPQPFISSGFGTSSIVNYIIGIGLLMGGMMMAQQIGGAGGKFAGNMYQKSGSMLSTFGKNLGGLRPFASWGAAKIKAGEFPGSQSRVGKIVSGIPLNPFNVYKNLQAGRKINREKLDRLGTAMSGDRMRTVGGRRGFLYGLGTPDIGPQYMTIRGFKNRMLWQSGAFKEAGSKLRQREFGGALRAFHGGGSGAGIRSRDDRIRDLEASIEGPEKIYSEKFVSWRADEKMREYATTYPKLQAALMATTSGTATSGQTSMVQAMLAKSQQEAEAEFAAWEASPEQNKYDVAHEWVSNRISNGATDLTAKNKSIDEEIQRQQTAADKKRNEVSALQAQGLDSKKQLEALRGIERAIKKLKDEKALVKEQTKTRTTDLQSFGRYKNIPFATENEKVDMRKKLADERKRKEASVAFQAQDFEARAEWRTATLKAQQNVRTKNEYELVRLFSSAMANKDRSMAAAVLMQASEVGHLNELLMGTKDKDGKKYNANATDFNRFVNEQLIGNLGMSQQQAYMTQNDASEKAQAARHWIFAQTNEMDSQGNWTQRDAATQEAAASIEMAKVNPQSAARETGRFGYFTEVLNEQGERQTQWTAIGVQQLKRVAGQFFAGLDTDTNKSTIEHMAAPQNIDVTMKIIDDIAQSSDMIGKTKVEDIKKFLQSRTTGGGAKEIEAALEKHRKKLATSGVKV